MKLLFAALFALMAVGPVFAAELATSLKNTLTIIVVTEWTDGVINEIPMRTLAPDVRLVNGLSLQRVNDLYFDHIGQTYEFNTAQTGWGGHEYYQCRVTIEKDPGVVGLYMMIMGSHDFTIEGLEDEVKLICEQATWSLDGVITSKFGEDASKNTSDEADRVILRNRLDA